MVIFETVIIPGEDLGESTVSGVGGVDGGIVKVDERVGGGGRGGRHVLST